MMYVWRGDGTGGGGEGVIVGEGVGGTGRVWETRGGEGLGR